MNAVSRSAIAAFAFLVALGAMMAWLVVGDPISQRKWDRIQQGMTRAEVVKILGEPHSLDGNQIEYSRFLNVGWVEFAFDESGMLIWKNDESAFGSLK
jgi:hypothetical protein